MSVIPASAILTINLLGEPTLVKPESMMVCPLLMWVRASSTLAALEPCIAVTPLLKWNIKDEMEFYL